MPRRAHGVDGVRPGRIQDKGGGETTHAPTAGGGPEQPTAWVPGLRPSSHIIPREQPGKLTGKLHCAGHGEQETRLAAVRERLENKRLDQQVAGLQQAMNKLEARAQARRRDADSGARSSNMMRSKQQVLAGKYPPLVYREKLKEPWFHAVTPQKWEVSAVVHL